MDRKDFMHQLRRYQRGSISRRQFLGTTGLGVASLVLARELGIRARPAYAKGEFGDRVSLCTWPSYHDPANFDAFTEAPVPPSR